jgi:hypothetical protein
MADREEKWESGSGAGVAPVPDWEKTVGFLHGNPHGAARGENVRLEFMEKLRLSVEAMGRSEENMSARLKAGMGDAKDCVGVGADARELAEDLRVTSGQCVLAIESKWSGRH